MIELRHLKKIYENAEPLKDVSVTINDGDVIAVIGPSGTGKSTLIRCINLLEKPTSGQVFLNGEEITAKGYDVRKARQKMGMVFQSFNLFGHLTVIENLMTPPMDLLGKSRQEAYDTAVELLRRVGLADKALNYPDELSGGQQQRVAIARTLAMDPEIILLDEPTSALDPTMVSEVQAVIRDLSRSGKTMMIVTHEMNFARAIASRVFYIDEDGSFKDVYYNEDMVQYPEIWEKIHAKLAGYGFILRYLKGREHITGYGYEPWHIRYLDDPEIAAEIMDSDITLEEYLAGAKAPAAEIDYGTSAIYTQADLDEAIVQIKCRFAAFGCELHSLTYAGDEAASAENLAWMNELDEGQGYTQVCEFLSSFHAPADAGGAWEPDAEYTDWQWWLARTGEGGWQVLTWGY